MRLTAKMKHLTGKVLFLAGLQLLGFLYDANNSAAAFEHDICEREMIAASRAENIPLGVLYAVGLTETGRKGRLHPYSLNVEGKTIITESASDALTQFTAARRQGKKLIDLGCMQINHYYHGSEFESVAAMLDPHRNVTYAAQFLKHLKQREKSWTMAVARYHAGPDNDPAQKRYICAVIRNLVTTGFGTWTTAARQFCGERSQQRKLIPSSGRHKP